MFVYGYCIRNDLQNKLFRTGLFWPVLQAWLQQTIMDSHPENIVEVFLKLHEVREQNELKTG